MTDRVEVISKEIDGTSFTGLRLYLYLPTTLGGVGGLHGDSEGRTFPAKVQQAKGPFIHRPGDDDSAAITFWGKRDLRTVLVKMIEKLDEHYASRPPKAGPITEID
jgi:hypothetical protein